MSPGKPGAGGAGTRRTGWRRRRRRWRLEAATGAPGLGRRAEPDSRIPGTYQDAREMKRAAREAQPPPRSPRLRWALPPLLLLLLSLGQVSRREGPGPGGGRGWRPLHLPREPHLRASRAPAGACVWSSHLEGLRGPATEPLPRLPNCRRGLREPGSRGARCLPLEAPALAAGRL